MRARGNDERVMRDGELIFAEGDNDRQMFIVATGRVRITKAQGGREITLRMIERGEFFGEMALLESLPRSATAYAVGETHLVVIEPGSLLLRLRRDPTLAIEMLHTLSARIRSLSNRLVVALDHTDENAAAEWGIGPDDERGAPRED
jgi:CRP/FNR family transcriptional regulator, cyclic AMP receptor protein